MSVFCYVDTPIIAKIYRGSHLGCLYGSYASVSLTTAVWTAYRTTCYSWVRQRWGQAHHEKWLGQNPTSLCLVQTWATGSTQFNYWHTGSYGTNNAAGNTLDRVGLANQWEVSTVCVLVLCMLLVVAISCEAREMFVDTCGQPLLKTDITNNLEASVGQLETQVVTGSTICILHESLHDSTSLIQSLLVPTNLY